MLDNFFPVQNLKSFQRFQINLSHCPAYGKQEEDYGKPAENVGEKNDCRKPIIMKSYTIALTQILILRPAFISWMLQYGFCARFVPGRVSIGDWPCVVVPGCRNCQTFLLTFQVQEELT